MNGHIGAAAVILSPPSSTSSLVLQKRTQYIGTDTQSTVYAAELKGILLALEILMANACTNRTNFIIFCDNQSALKTLQNPGNTSGQFILVELLQALDEATTAGLDVQFRWIPAHRGIPGNEIADRAAKEATNPPTTTSTTNRDPDRNSNIDNNNTNNTSNANNTANTIRTLLTTAKRTINTALHQEWELAWTHAKHGRVLHDLGRKPDKMTLQLHRKLPRPISSIITQMRTGKIGLNAYLHGIDKAESSQCTCNQGTQAVEHVLLRCRNWKQERQEMWAGSRPVLSLKGVLGDHKLVVRAAHMMLRTGLLQQFQAVSTTAPTGEDAVRDIRGGLRDVENDCGE
jgi:ribonuclease HI